MRSRRMTRPKPRTRAGPQATSSMPYRPENDFKLDKPFRTFMSSPEVYATFSTLKNSRGVKDGILAKYCGAVFNVTPNGLSWGTYNVPYSTGSTAFTGVTLSINPYFQMPFGSTIAALALSYNKFKYTKLKYYMVGSSGSQDSGALYVTYNPDGAFTTLFTNTNFSTALTQPVYGLMPTWTTTVLDLTKHLNTDQMYYTDYAAVTSADYRQAYQGAVALLPNQLVINHPTPINWGIVMVEAEVILSEPMPYAQNIVSPGSGERTLHRHRQRDVLDASEPAPEEEKKEQTKSKIIPESETMESLTRV